MASLAYREKVVRAWLDPIANAFTTFGIWAIIIIVRLFLSFFLLFVSSGRLGGALCAPLPFFSGISARTRLRPRELAHASFAAGRCREDGGVKATAVVDGMSAAKLPGVNGKWEEA